MKERFVRLRVLLVLALLLTPFYTLSYAHAESVYESSETADYASGDIVPGQVLVKYKNGRLGLSSAKGFKAQSITSSIQKLSFSEEIPVSEKVRELSQDPNVAFVEPVYRYRATGQFQAQGFTVTDATYNWGKTVTQLTYASQWTSLNPLNQLDDVVVAVLDSGVELNHPDLQSALVAGYDFINHDSDPSDDNGHGTHVAGIIGANEQDISTPYTGGAAPGVKVMPIKVLDSEGFGTTAEIIAGIEHAIAHKDVVRIINMSLGSSGDSVLLHEAIKRAIAANIVVVAAAGNQGNNWINGEAGQLDDSPTDMIRTTNWTDYPAAYEEVVSVGALGQLPNSTLAVADFSNTGKVDVSAPGVNIYSTFLNGKHAWGSGTSQATPFVSALAALVIANDPGLNVTQTRAIIENSNEEMSPLELSFRNVDLGTNFTVKTEQFYGHGRIDGQNIMTRNRLELSMDFSKYDTDKSVTAAVYLKDIRGQLVQGDHSVKLTNTQYYEDDRYLGQNHASDLGWTEKPIPVHNGFGTITFNVSNTLKPAFRYRFLASDDLDPVGTVPSNASDWIRRPATPVPSPAAGTYTGNATISLASETPNSEIGYRLLAQSELPDNLNDIPLISYRAPFTIDKTTVVVTQAYNNHVFSEREGYAYSITPAPTPTPRPVGGGGGGAPAPTPPPGVTVVDESPLLSQLYSTKEEPVPIPLNVKEGATDWGVQLSGFLLQTALKNKKALDVQANGTQIRLTPGAFPVTINSAVLLKTKLSSDMETAGVTGLEQTQLASPVYDFTLTVDAKPVTVFDKPLQVTLPYDPSKVKDPSKLAIYYYDETAKAWQKVGGTLSGNGTITVELSHFSKYAVLETLAQTRSFVDLEGHWAKKEVEEMAARGIVEGVAEDQFGPEQSVTRAQFVTLVSRALKLPEGDTSSPFTDVERSEWYGNHVYAAYRAKLVSGVEADRFAPNDLITREQLAVLMVNAYLYQKNMKLADIVVTQEVKFADEGTVSEWARSAVRVASALGLMSGDEQGRFNPAERTTRAQAAVVLYRLLNSSNK